MGITASAYLSGRAQARPDGGLSIRAAARLPGYSGAASRHVFNDEQLDLLPLEWRTLVEYGGSTQAFSAMELIVRTYYHADLQFHKHVDIETPVTRASRLMRLDQVRDAATTPVTKWNRDFRRRNNLCALVPGTQLFYLGAFGKRFGQHHFVYLGRVRKTDSSKYRYVQQLARDILTDGGAKYRDKASATLKEEFFHGFVGAEAIARAKAASGVVGGNRDSAVQPIGVSPAGDVDFIDLVIELSADVSRGQGAQTRMQIVPLQYSLQYALQMGEAVFAEPSTRNKFVGLYTVVYEPEDVGIPGRESQPVMLRQTEVIRRALLMLGKLDYSEKFSNCDTLASFIVAGKFFSKQVCLTTGLLGDSTLTLSRLQLTGRYDQELFDHFEREFKVERHNNSSDARRSASPHADAASFNMGDILEVIGDEEEDSV